MREKRANEYSSFFQNRECEYFPCHKTNCAEEFNCLFCYCPLYALGEKCGGNFTYTENGIKNCTDCLFPHRRESAANIADRFPEIAELAKKQDK
ncbi:MAG: cysteine-rich small domain-containing protein [Clostridia bacterium]|nr:cysteine-rich small domain-containing protein [Clostridia bacterium]